MHADITRARVADAPWITEIWNHIIGETLVTFTTIPKTRGEVVDLIAAQPVFVMQDQGFATYGAFRSGPGYAATVEHTIYMAPDHCGRGHGSKLMAHLEAYAAQMGHRVMVAGISGANPAALRFHARLGFEQVGQMPQVGFKHGQWLDLILMQKMLNPPDTAAHSL